MLKSQYLFHAKLSLISLFSVHSLLTLSRVIAALGSPSRTHINFRDSKLTRILQPSLSGNARMAIICCATPSEMYLEETRSSLQFASRAKLVKTRATINEVLDERSMIKKLQKELAAARRAADGEIDLSQIRELESEAARAENLAKTAQDKYEKLKASILKGGMFQGDASGKHRKRISSTRTPAKGTIVDLGSPSAFGIDRKRRRQSDGIVHHYNSVSSPLLDLTNRNNALSTLTPTLERRNKNDVEETMFLQDSGSFQIILLKEALAAKGNIARDTDKKLSEWQDKAERYEVSLDSARSEIDTLKEDHSSTVAQAELLSAEKEGLELQRQDILDEVMEMYAEKDSAINEALSTIESMLREKEIREESIESLQDLNIKQSENFKAQEDAWDELRCNNNAAINKIQVDLSSSNDQCQMLQEKCTVYDTLVEEKDASIAEHVASLESSKTDNVELSTHLDQANGRNIALTQANEALQDKLQNLTSIISNLNSDLTNGHDVVAKLQEQKGLAESLATQMSDKEDLALTEVQGLVDQMVASEERGVIMQSRIEELEQMLPAMEDKLNQAEALANSVQTENASTGQEVGNLQIEIRILHKENNDLGILLSETTSTNVAFSAENATLKEELNLVSAAVTKLKEDVVNSESLNNTLSQEKELVEALATHLSDAEDSTLAHVQFLATQLQQMQSMVEAKDLTNSELMVLCASLEDQLNQARVDNELISDQNTVLNEQLQTLSATIQGVRDELVNKDSTADSLNTDKELAEALANHLSEAEDSALTQLRELEGQVCDLKNEIEKRESELEVLSKSKSIADENVENAKTDNKIVSQQNSDLNEQLQSLLTIVAELRNELANKTSNIDTLLEEKELAETLARQMSDAEDSALTQLRELEGQVCDLENQIAERESELEALSKSKSIADENLEHSRADCSEIAASNRSLKEELHLLLCTVAGLTDGLAASSDAVESLVTEKELSEVLASQMSDAEDSALSQVQNLVEHVHLLQTDVLENSAMNTELVNDKKELEANLHQISRLLDKSVGENKDLAETNNTLSDRVKELSIEISNLNNSLTNGDSAAENLLSEKNRIQDLLSEMTDAKNAASANVEEIRKKLVEVNSELSELKISKASLEESLRSELANLTSTNSMLEKDAASKQSQLEILTSEKDLAKALASQISQMEDCAIQCAHRASEDLCEARNRCIALRAENEKLILSKDQDQDLLEKLRIAEERIESIELTLNEHRQHVNTLNEENEALLDSALEESKVSSTRHAEELLIKEAEIKKIAEEILNLEDTLQRCNVDLSNMTMNYNIEAQKLADANQELNIAHVELSEARNRSEPSPSDYKNDQIQELQQLLASANGREEEAKNIAIATDEELESKERDYEEAVLFASECEAAAKEWEQKYRLLEAREPASTGQDTEEILNEMELLLDEKSELEKKLETALSDRDALEKDLRKKHEHDQKELLQEADAKMKCLRDVVILREKELDKHKRDARMTREELVAIQEQLKSDQSAAIDADEKVLQLTEQLSSAEQASTKLTNEVEHLRADYKAFKEHVSASKESFKQAAERKLTSAKGELASLKETLHEETLKARSFEEKVELYKREVFRLEAEMTSTKQSLINEKEYAVSKVKEEIALAKVELSRAHADIFSLNQDVDHYKAVVKKAKQERRSDEEIAKYQQSLKEHEDLLEEKNGEINQFRISLASCQDDVDQLKKHVKDLKSKIKSKDERIKNLEAKRLTKEHVAMIKKLKEERRTFKDDAEDLRRRLANADLSSNDKENYNHKSFEADFAKLQIKNEALEKKLRKYIAHSDVLTKEIRAIQEMIKETVADSNFQEVGDKDLSAAVVELCERYHTVEEECNAMSDAKTALHNTLLQAKSQLNEVTNENIKLEEDLEVTKKEVVALSQRQSQFQEIAENVKGSAKDLEEEKNRQVSYLEKENLHILEENKTLKKQVRALKSHSKASKLTVQDEPTEDLGSILSTLNSQDKENNLNGSIKSPYRATTKTSSKTRVGLGSGEGEINDDNTQECQQS